MSDMTPPAGAASQLHLFRKNLSLRLRLQELVRSLGATEGLTCLDVGSESGALSYHLRKTGGKWATVAVDEVTAAAIREVVEENVVVFGGQPFPFEKKTFDAVAIVDSLERVADDSFFIEECHKVLKADGRLVISVSRIKPWALIRLLRRLFGLTFERKGRVREGYTETDLFNVLKDGFDVLSMRSYSRFFVELTDLLVEWIRGRLVARGGDPEAAMRRLYKAAGPFYWLAFQIDLLLIFSRGHRMIAEAKRRAWRPRKTPVLVDGRSITEAVLSRAAD